MKSESKIETDAPIDNQGKGARFSPTDLVATALASCMLTIMGIAANTHRIDINDTNCSVEKIMETAPRRIGKIKIQVHFPKHIKYSDKEKMKLVEEQNREYNFFILFKEEIDNLNSSLSFLL